MINKLEKILVDKKTENIDVFLQIGRKINEIIDSVNSLESAKETECLMINNNDINQLHALIGNRLKYTDESPIGKKIDKLIHALLDKMESDSKTSEPANGQ